MFDRLFKCPAHLCSKFADLPTIRPVEWLRALLRRLDSETDVPYERELLAGVLRVLGEYTTDPLTGLYNRRAFEECLQHTIGLNQLFGYPATMMLIDIDHFKQVNDTYGHAAGDAVLKAVAEQIVRVCKRRSDFAARYGGEEFAVILRETTLREAQRIAQQLAEQVRRHAIPIPDSEPIRVTVSIGVSELRANEGADEWFRRTDALLYQAKQAGRDQVAA
jgi:diguanylate cyclase (GGDEF)-like protein